MDRRAELDRMFQNGEQWLRGVQWDHEDHAADMLRTLFPWDWARSTANRHPWHPVIAHAVFRGHAEALLSVGAFLARFPGKVRSIRQRLREHDQFMSCLAELRVGMLLHRVGAKVTHEPYDDPKPDWLAQWDDGCLVVEAKQPRLSDLAQASDAATNHLVQALMRQLPSPTEAAYLTLRLDADFRLPYAKWKGLTFDAIEDAAKRIADSLPYPTSNLRWNMPGIGSVETRLGAHGPRQFHVSACVGLPDEPHEVRKLRSLLQDTVAQQLKGVPHPTLIALELSRDRQVAQYGAEIRRMLDEDWARALGGVLLVGALDERLVTRNRLLLRPATSGPLRRLQGLLESDWLSGS